MQNGECFQSEDHICKTLTVPVITSIIKVDVLYFMHNIYKTLIYNVYKTLYYIL